MLHNRPLGLNTVVANTNAGSSLARLNGLESFSRSIIVGVIPLLAYKAVGNKEAVAHMYLMASIFTFCITLNFSRLERIIQRRWVISLSAVFISSAAVLFYSANNNWLFALGISLRSSAASLFSVCLSLYIMDYITRKQLALVESRRLVYVGMAWLIGPFLGGWLWDQGHFTVPFIISIFFSLLMLSYFWYLRLGDNQILTNSRQKPVISPLKAVPRYFSQKKLRIAYFITLTRAVYWTSFYIYAPIYVIEAKLPVWAAGILVSGVSGLLLFSPLVRRLAERYSTRKVMILALTSAGFSMFALAAIGKPAPLGILFWCTAALGCICLDVLGNIPFMRMVKSYERTDMTMVFSTWREMSELVTPLSITLITLFFPFSVYYLAFGCVFLIVSVYATLLPKRL